MPPMLFFPTSNNVTLALINFIVFALWICLSECCPVDLLYFCLSVTLWPSSLARWRASTKFWMVYIFGMTLLFGWCILYLGQRIWYFKHSCHCNVCVMCGILHIIWQTICIKIPSQCSGGGVGVVDGQTQLIIILDFYSLSWQWRLAFGAGDYCISAPMQKCYSHTQCVQQEACPMDTVHCPINF